jgi:hypothetical protein
MELIWTFFEISEGIIDEKKIAILLQSKEQINE